MKQLLPIALRLTFLGSLFVLIVDIFTYSGAVRNNFYFSPLVLAIGLAVLHGVIRWKTTVGFGTNFAKATILAATPFFLTLYALMDHVEEFSNKVFYPNYFFENVEIDLRSLLPLAVAILVFGLVHSTKQFWKQYGELVWFNSTFWLIMLSGVFYFNNLGNLSVWNNFVKEDGIVEYATAAAFGIAGLVALGIARKSGQFAVTNRGKFIFAWLARLAGVALILVALEEISWGQRIFDITTPEQLAAINTQSELTLHNNELIWPMVYWGYLAIALHGAFAWIGAWILNEMLPKSKLASNWVHLLVPKAFLFLNFFLMVIYVWLRKVNGVWQYSKMEELTELFLVVGILAHLMSVFYLLRKQGQG